MQIMKRWPSFIYCTLLSIILLTSCDEYKLQKQLERFTAEEIVVSGKMRQTVAGRDSVMLVSASEDIRLIVWVDSLTCSMCRVNKMLEYSQIVDFHKEMKGKFVPLFVFSPSQNKIREVLQSLETTQFAYPVFVDERQEFPAANPHIPADNRFHTFLIDKNGKVVLVGDPVNNPQLWELYKTTITTLIGNGGTMPEVEK
jgi:hypothetical protein